MSYLINGKESVFIFDVDGVIADTPQEKSWFLASQEMGLYYQGDFSKFYQANMAGVPRKVAAEALIKYFQGVGDIDKVNSLMERKQDIFLNLVNTGQFNIYEDVLRIIHESKKRGVVLGVCSSSDNSEELLRNTPSLGKERLYELFVAITAGAKKYGVSDKTELYKISYRRILEKVDVDNPFVLVWEDADSGIKAAKNAGFSCIGIARNGLTTPDLLKKCGADIAYDESTLSRISFDRIHKDLASLV